MQSDAASDDGRDAHVQIATNGSGVWVALWTSTDTLGGTTDSDADIHFARSVDDGITWSSRRENFQNFATLADVAFALDQFVIVGLSGTIVTTPNACSNPPAVR